MGWNIQYEWMNSDLKAAMTQVKLYIEDQEEVPWETLNVQVSEITYGGRVTDSWDKRLYYFSIINQKLLSLLLYHIVKLLITLHKFTFYPIK